jgi:PPM family protein phosphatase
VCREYPEQELSIALRDRPVGRSEKRLFDNLADDLKRRESVKIFSVTRQGLARKKNEDRSLTKRFDNGAALVAVADGMGGHAAGEVAAQIAVDSLDGFDQGSQTPETQLLDLALAARREVQAASEEDGILAGMGTTLTAVFIKDAMAHWIHVGDSRLYLFRENVLVQVTEDHTIVSLLLREGEITREEARVHPLQNVLMSCIGCQQLKADTGSFEVKPGDLLLLSTDGLHDRVSEEEMESLLRFKRDLRDKLDVLTDAAIARNARDDVTIVAVEI